MAISIPVNVSASIVASQVSTNQSNSILLLTKESPISGSSFTDYKKYTKVLDLSKDFATDSTTYKMASVILSQTGQNVISAGGCLYIYKKDSQKDINENLIDASKVINFCAILTDDKTDYAGTELTTLIDFIKSKPNTYITYLGYDDIISAKGSFTTIKNQNLDNVFPCYHKTEPYSLASGVASLQHSLNYENGKAIDIQFKSLTGVPVDETITDDILNEIVSTDIIAQDGIIFYANYENVRNGIVANTQKIAYPDNTYNKIILNEKCKFAIFNLLSTTKTKLLQNNTTSVLVDSTLRKILTQAVANEILSPGTWDSPDFYGTDRSAFLKSIEKEGFFISPIDFNRQVQLEREKRTIPGVYIYAKFGGSCHMFNLNILLEQ